MSLLQALQDSTFESFVSRLYETREQKEALLGLAYRSEGLSKCLLLPNYEYDELSGPQGFVAQFAGKSVFSPDFFIQEKYRVMMAAEVHVPEEIWEKAQFERFRDILQKYLPLWSPSPPCLFDQPGSSWAPSLGERGCSLGLYRMKEDTLDGTTRDRWFLVVHTSLPDQTLLEMQLHDEKLRFQNQKLLGAFQELEEELEGRYKSNQKVLGAMGDIVTFHGAFGPHSVNDRMRKVSLENARRLLVLAARLTNLQLIEKEARWQESEGVEEKVDASQASLMKEGVAYRQDGFNFEALKGDDPGKLLKKLTLALDEWLIRGVPIPSFLVIPALPAQGPLPKTKELRGFPVGAVLLEYKNKYPNLYPKLEQEYNIELLERPYTLDEDVCSQYNTFLVGSLGNVTWYSNCTPTYERHGGILTQMSLEIGYRVSMPEFTVDGKKWASQQHPNQAEDSFPCVFPFQANAHKVISAHTKPKFFGSSDRMPAQLMGHFDTRHTEMQESRSKFAIDLDDPKAVSLEPIQVLLSALTMEPPTF